MKQDIIFYQFRKLWFDQERNRDFEFFDFSKAINGFIGFAGARKLKQSHNYEMNLCSNTNLQNASMEWPSI